MHGTATWRLSTAQAMRRIGEVGHPRCDGLAWPCNASAMLGNGKAGLGWPRHRQSPELQGRGYAWPSLANLPNGVATRPSATHRQRLAPRGRSDPELSVGVAPQG